METSDSCRDDKPVGRICFRELLPAPGDPLFGSQRVSHLVNAALDVNEEGLGRGGKIAHPFCGDSFIHRFPSSANAAVS